MSRPNPSARRLLVWVAGALVLAAMGGCGQAVRYLRETPNGGTITMPTNTNRWPTYYRSRAAYLMQKKCPDGYRIDREAAVGIGLETPASNPPHESYFGYTGGSEAEQEYHITFHGTPLGNRPPTKQAPLPSDKPGSPRPLSPSVEAGTEELPPPRSLGPTSK
jgi:hypothetical protein